MNIALPLAAGAAATASVFAFAFGSVEIGLVFAMVAGAIAMGFDGK